MPKPALALSVLLALAVAAAAEPPWTAADARDGWLQLFDGQTAFGWQAADAGADRGAAPWTVRDGSLTVRPESRLTRLRHRSVFADFELSMQVKLADDSSGSVLVRAEPVGPVAGVVGGRLATHGYRFDLRTARVETPRQRPRPGPPALPTGDWYDLTVTAVGPRIVFAVNGEQRAEVADAGRRFGSVVLEHAAVGGPVQFRQVRLKPLTLTPLTVGDDLAAEWIVRDLPPELLTPRWRMKDGVVHVDVPPKAGIDRGGRGYLESRRHVADFVVQLEARTNGRHLNSGLFFRTVPGSQADGYEAQIHNGHADGDPTVPLDFGTGGIYRRRPARRVIPGDGAWFSMTVQAHGPAMNVWVEGVQVTSFTDERKPDPNARKGYAAGPGALSLQAHDPTTDLDFRNLRVGSW